MPAETRRQQAQQADMAFYMSTGPGSASSAEAMRVSKTSNSSNGVSADGKKPMRPTYNMDAWMKQGAKEEPWNIPQVRQGGSSTVAAEEYKGVSSRYGTAAGSKPVQPSYMLNSWMVQKPADEPWNNLQRGSRDGSQGGWSTATVDGSGSGVPSSDGVVAGKPVGRSFTINAWVDRKAAKEP